jgi:hypothetical protein
MKIKNNKEVADVIERLQITDRHAVLDIGSGGGRFSRQI